MSARTLFVTIEQAVDLYSRVDILAAARHGIGHAHAGKSVHRTYEIYKVPTVASHRDPDPQFKLVDCDGLLVRYTNDPEPAATIVA